MKKTIAIIVITILTLSLSATAFGNGKGKRKNAKYELQNVQVTSYKTNQPKSGARRKTQNKLGNFEIQMAKRRKAKN